MSITLAQKYIAATDELFKAESKKQLFTNTDYDWTGAHSVLVWKISTTALNDYARNRFADDPESAASLSRYGEIYDLNAATEEMLLTKDRSFIFNIDKMDTDETSAQLEAQKALARELREVVVPEVDTYVINKMVTGAGKTATAVALTAANIYEKILDASEWLDDKEVPDSGRVLIVSAPTYTLMKKAGVFDSTDVGAELRLNGVVATLDGAAVVKVPSARLPQKFGFMLAHPSATVAPVKLEDYGVHNDTIISSGSIVTGRVVYDAFVLDNKADGIYYQPIS